MKIKFISVAFLAIVLSLIISGYKEGPAQYVGWSCTGAETDQNNPKGCTTGGGCHASAATAGINVALELDSAGVAVTGYKGGQTYTVKIAGVNTTSSNLPRFGFQIAAIVGSVAQSTPTNAGTWGTPPTNTHIATPGQYFVLKIFEHGTPLSPATGTGATGTTYGDSIIWTAPAAGTGTISFWGALNAVNNNGVADAGDLWNTTQLVLTEDTAATTSAITYIQGIEDISLFPNPVTDNLNLQWNSAFTGNCTVSVFDLSGQKMVSSVMAVQSGTNFQSINAAAWAPGIYLVNVEQGGMSRVYRVVKQ